MAAFGFCLVGVAVAVVLPHGRNEQLRNTRRDAKPRTKEAPGAVWYAKSENEKSGDGRGLLSGILCKTDRQVCDCVGSEVECQLTTVD